MTITPGPKGMSSNLYIIQGQERETQNIHFKERRVGWGFPGGAVVENLPADAGDTGFDPWSRKIPRAVEQLSPYTTTTEPVL